jgi:hypothetical protein
MRINQVADRDADPGLFESSDNEVAFPGAVSIALPML